MFNFRVASRRNRVLAALMALLFACMLALVLFGLGLVLAAVAGVALAATLARSLLGRTAPIVREELAVPEDDGAPRVITGEFRAIPDSRKDDADSA